MSEQLAGETVRVVAIAATFVLIVCGGIVTTRLRPELNRPERALTIIYGLAFILVGVCVGINAVIGPEPTPGVVAYAWVATPLAGLALLFTALSLRDR